MTPAALARLRQICDERRRLDDEEATILSALDSELLTTGAPADILSSDHVTVGQLAAILRKSEKTSRDIGIKAGARIQIGGRVLYDLAAIRRHVASKSYRVLPSSSVSDGAQIRDDVIEDER